MITEENRKKFIDCISSLENQFMLEHLMELKNSSEADKIYMISDQEREGIKRGLEDLENGKVKTNEEVKAELRNKFSHFLK
ncbi:MAG TPA: hypothetical protein VLA71_17495 [Algoriphagus sp.]|nr:hypothetical protein [Algoriphagus sp.]